MDWIVYLLRREKKEAGSLSFSTSAAARDKKVSQKSDAASAISGSEESINSLK